MSGHFSKIVSISHRIVQIPFISIFLQGKVCNWGACAKPNKIVRWGLRPRSFQIKTNCGGVELPYVYLEDGFLRSYGSGQNFPPLALVIDQSGIYYNCNMESQLEKLVSSILYSSEEVLRTQVSHATSLIVQKRLTKYNHQPNFTPNLFSLDDENRILVIDQTNGDMSVFYGGADADAFVKMLDNALSENPSATIYIKTHPEVTSGRKKGYLSHIQNTDRIVMIRDDVNPIDLIQKMDKVYVVTSQMGFEALMCGKPVVCFGVPWYAGWGLTDDRVKDSPAWKRRTKKRTVDELFAAAYIHYTRYLNPFTHKRGKITDVINWLILQKKMAHNPFIRDFSSSEI